MEREATTEPAPRRRRTRSTRLGALAALLLVGVCAVSLLVVRSRSYANVRWRAETHPQSTWAACNRNARSSRPSTFHPLSDRAAAALVTPEPETRPDNARPFRLAGRNYAAVNDDVPTARQLAAFRSARTSTGQRNLAFNPYYAYVDGRDGLRHPSTDDLIQWAAHKWGIPENWLRAEYVRESYWNAFQLGDLTTVPASWYRRYPPQSRQAGSSAVYQSLGLSQVRWTPDGSLHPGTEPLRWESTAFNLDYQAATLRFYYDNPRGTRSQWGDSSYRPCEQWQSIGAWYQPYPWGNSGQAGYVRQVQSDLSARVWRSGSFAAWSAPLPPGVSLR